MRRALPGPAAGRCSHPPPGPWAGRTWCWAAWCSPQPDAPSVAHHPRARALGAALRRLPRRGRCRGSPRTYVPDLRRIGPVLRVDGGREFVIKVPGVMGSGLDDAQVAEVTNWLLATLARDSVPAGHRPFDAGRGHAPAPAAAGRRGRRTATPAAARPRAGRRHRLTVFDRPSRTRRVPRGATMKRLTAIATAAGLLLVAAAPALAATEAQAAALGNTLTPLGAEKAANRDGSIPAWTGGDSKAPGGWKPGRSATRPLCGRQAPLHHRRRQRRQVQGQALAKASSRWSRPEGLPHGRLSDAALLRLTRASSTSAPARTPRTPSWPPTAGAWKRRSARR
jgi:hypothetical protein